METIRKAAVAGMFYPSGKKELYEMVSAFIKNADKINIGGKIKALIVPHAGYIYSGIVAAHGYKLLEGKNFKKVILVGPSHYFGFKGAAFDSSDYWETPLGKIRIAREKERDIIKKIKEVHEEEHSLEVQLPFLQFVLKDFELLPIATCHVNSEELAKEIGMLLGVDDLLIASSDLSHFYNYDKALKIDGYASEFIPKLGIASVERNVEACGKTGIIALMHIAKNKKWKCRLVKYLNSGDTSGNKESVVGYGCYVFYK